MSENSICVDDDGKVLMESTDAIYVNDERTVLVEMWPDGTVSVASRVDPSATWGSPVYLKREDD